MEMVQIFFSYVLPFLIFAFFLIKWIFAPSNTHKNLPPSPRRLPVIGNFHQIGRYRHRSLHALAQRHGPIMLLHFGKEHALVISSKELAREILKTHDVIFIDRPKSSIANKLLYDCKDMSAAPYGEYWRQLRSICALQLLSNKRVHSFRAIREEEVALLIKNIENSASLSLPVNLSEMFSSLSNDVTCRAAFGKKYSEGESGRKFNKLLAEFVGLLGGFCVGDFVPWLGWVDHVSGLNAKLERVAKEFDNFVDGIIEDHLHRRSVESKDFVDVLLDHQKNNLTSISLETVSIKALILDMFAGGTDTTHTVIDWTMTELLRHPRVMKELQNEVRQINNGQSYVKTEDIEKMNYLKAVLKEVLRLYPAIPLLLPRKSTQDVRINGYDIPAGTIVITNAWAIGRDPATWDDPEEFKPERFLNISVDYKGHDFEFIPFGAGRRGCPGISFAMATNELLLANLVNKFDWSLPDGIRIQDLDMAECSGSIIHRKAHLLAVATPVNLN